MSDDPAESLPARGRIGRSSIVAGLLVLIGLSGLLGLSELVRDGISMPFDPALLLALREPGNLADPIGSATFEGYVRDFTALGGVVILTLLTSIAIVYLLLAGKPKAALLVFLAIAGGQVVSTLLKLAVDRARPDVVPHLMTESSLSFPSGHAMMSAVAYLTFASIIVRFEPRPWLRVFVYAVAVLLFLGIGASRVYLGVHWPSDVLAGWCAGIAWAMLWVLIGDWWLKRPPGARG